MREPWRGPAGTDTDLGSWPPWSVDIDQRPDRKFWRGFVGAPAATEGAETSSRFPCLLYEEGRAGSLSGVRVGLGPGVGPKVWHMWLLYPLGAVCRGHAQSSAFAPSSSELASDFFLSFSIFLSIICPSCPGTQLFLVCYSFFAFCCWRRHLSRY